MQVSDKIVDYYNKNKRKLPWRISKDPYKIWISEIMLQQTRVDQAHDYFTRFITLFPDVQTLASADEDTVLKLWQGLGYYSRARNMHYTAKFIVQNLNGKFPGNFTDLKQLKGIGEYTAAAIASIAFNEKVAAIDGNVYRVLARIFNEHSTIDTAQGKKRFKELANSLIANHPPGDFNQAMMEFGAMVCKPAKPLCEQCPVLDQCEAFRKNTVNSLPVKKSISKVKNRYFHYLILIDNEKTYLQKRKDKDIWKGLYEFPLIETKQEITFEKLFQTKKFIEIAGNDFHIHHISDEIKHRLSHQLLHIRFYAIATKNTGKNHEWISIPLQELKKFPFPKVIDDYIVKILLGKPIIHKDFVR